MWIQRHSDRELIYSLMLRNRSEGRESHVELPMQSQKPALLESERRKSRKNVDDGCHGKKFIVSLTDDLGHVVRRN